MGEGEREEWGGGDWNELFFGSSYCFFLCFAFVLFLLSLSFAFVSLFRVFSRTCVSGRFGYRRSADGNPSPILCMEARAVFY